MPATTPSPPRRLLFATPSTWVRITERTNGTGLRLLQGRVVKIEDIWVDQFDCWSQLALRGLHCGVNVLHAPTSAHAQALAQALAAPLLAAHPHQPLADDRAADQENRTGDQENADDGPAVAANSAPHRPGHPAIRTPPYARRPSARAQSVTLRLVTPELEGVVRWTDAVDQQVGAAGCEIFPDALAEHVRRCLASGDSVPPGSLSPLCADPTQLPSTVDLQWLVERGMLARVPPASANADGQRPFKLLKRASERLARLRQQDHHDLRLAARRLVQARTAAHPTAEQLQPDRGTLPQTTTGSAPASRQRVEQLRQRVELEQHIEQLQGELPPPAARRRARRIESAAAQSLAILIVSLAAGVAMTAAGLAGLRQPWQGPLVAAGLITCATAAVLHSMLDRLRTRRGGSLAAADQQRLLTQQREVLRLMDAIVPAYDGSRSEQLEAAERQMADACRTPARPTLDEDPGARRRGRVVRARMRQQAAQAWQRYHALDVVDKLLKSLHRARPLATVGTRQTRADNANAWIGRLTSGSVDQVALRAGGELVVRSDDQPWRPIDQLADPTRAAVLTGLRLSVAWGERKGGLPMLWAAVDSHLAVDTLAIIDQLAREQHQQLLLMTADPAVVHGANQRGLPVVHLLQQAAEKDEAPADQYRVIGPLRVPGTPPAVPRRDPPATTHRLRQPPVHEIVSDLLSSDDSHPPEPPPGTTS